MPFDPVITKEIARLPARREDAHKGEVGRIVVIGGCADEVMMVGAPALAASAALRSGAGLVQMIVPQEIRAAVAAIAVCATTRTLPTELAPLLAATNEFKADVAVVGPGLGRSLDPSVVAAFLREFEGPIVLDADGLNLLAAADRCEIPSASRVIMTPHPGELRHLLASRGRNMSVDGTLPSRRAAGCALVEEFGCTAVIKGHGTIVTNGARLYINETGNSGMATGGTGDVLTGVIAALLGQRMEPLEAAILGVYLHGLAGDFAAEELGRRSMTALDLMECLPDAFCDHEVSETE